jgi:hypothetical protein
MYAFHKIVLTIRRRALVGLLGSTVLAPSALPAAAQAAGYQALPPETALARMAAGELSPGAIVAAFEEDGVRDGVLGNREAYSDEERTLLLDGIEDLITLGPRGDPELDRGVSYGFVAYSAIAHYLWDSAPEAREIPERLLRVYERTDSRSVRSSTIFHLALILPLDPAESPAITDLLVTIASQPTAQPGSPMPVTGVEALKVACEPGVVALRSLLDEGAITEWAARITAEGYSARDFPVNEALSRSGPRSCPIP